VKSVQAQSASKGWGPVWTSSYQAPYFDAVDTAQTLQQENIKTVIFFGAANDLRRLADEAGRRDWKPDLMLPGVFASKGMFDIPVTFEGRVFLGYSSMPSDHTAKGVSEFEKLHADYDIDYRHSAAQISAFVAARILVEGLKRAGRDLSRDRLVNELEGLADFQPGLMPPISYNATRRIGALGGYVVALDLEKKQFGQASKWIELQP
jgi:ABC-type branched-subunit amino acid transport system substrate-binding protein